MTETSPETIELAKRYIAHSTNERGEQLANVYETEAFKSLYDPRGADERKLRLPRKLLQVHNQYSEQTHLFQKLYYHPGLLTEDEERLRTAFNKQNELFSAVGTGAQVAWFGGLIPALYTVSKKVKPVSCGFFTVAWIAAYYKGVSPFVSARFQSALNGEAQGFAKKYEVKGDADYLN